MDWEWKKLEPEPWNLVMCVIWHYVTSEPPQSPSAEREGSERRWPRDLSLPGERSDMARGVEREGEAQVVYVQRRVWAGGGSGGRPDTLRRQAPHRHGHRRLFGNRLLLRTDRIRKNTHTHWTPTPRKPTPDQTLREQNFFKNKIRTIFYEENKQKTFLFLTYCF